MGESRRSLSEFVSDRPTRVVPLPWLETIPEWEAILEGWQNGFTQSQIRAWLIEECGYSSDDATPARMAHLSKKFSRFTRGA